MLAARVLRVQWLSVLAAGSTARDQYHEAFCAGRLKWACCRMGAHGQRAAVATQVPAPVPVRLPERSGIRCN